jgi:hypothetical protein
MTWPFTDWQVRATPARVAARSARPPGQPRRDACDLRRRRSRDRDPSRARSGEQGRRGSLVSTIHEFLDRAGVRAPRLHHGDREATCNSCKRRVRRGLDTRVRLEDALHLPDGKLPPTVRSRGRGFIASRGSPGRQVSVARASGYDRPGEPCARARTSPVSAGLGAEPRSAEEPVSLVRFRTGATRRSAIRDGALPAACQIGQVCSRYPMSQNIHS